MNHKNRILLSGVPTKLTSPYSANFAQAPQGPILRDDIPVPAFIRRRIDHALRFLFNPRGEMVNYGMRLIQHNLEREMKGGVVDVVDYPEEDEILRMVESTWYDVVGISIGAEALAVRAKAFARAIKRCCINPDVDIIFGNYGAASAKEAGILPDADGEVLWHNPGERRKNEMAGETSYDGEGVRSMRLFLGKRGVPLSSRPDDPIQAPVLQDNNANPRRSRVSRFVSERLGLEELSRHTGIVAAAVGCPNRCYFCNTSKMFGGRKIQLHSAPSLFEEIAAYYDEHENEQGSMPGISVTVMDENFTRPMTNLVELCRMIRESGKNIRLSIFGDIAGLHHYLREHGNFNELLRGGLSAVWIGIESQRDFFKKWGGAKKEDVEKIVQELQKLGIVVIGSFICGLPYHTEGPTTETEVNIDEDFAWTRDLGTAAYQVMTESFTALVDREKAEPITERTDEETWGHVVTNPARQHPHIPLQRLGELDRGFREREYLEKGPMTVRAILTMWDGYKNLSGSSDPCDLRAASYYYWSCKHAAHTFGLAAAFSTLPVFKEHSNVFLTRLAVFFREVDELPPPCSEDKLRYEQLYQRTRAGILPFVALVSGRMRKRFAKKYEQTTIGP